MSNYASTIKNAVWIWFNGVLFMAIIGWVDKGYDAVIELLGRQTLWGLSFMALVMTVAPFIVGLMVKYWFSFFRANNNAVKVGDD
jgi:hypothetical protein